MAPRTAASSPRPAFARWVSQSNSITQQFMAMGIQPDFISMAGGLPAAEFYPAAAIAEASEKAMARSGSMALEYGPIEGFPALRQHIAERISREAGRTFTIENVLLTTGAMQGLDLLGKVLIDPGDRVVAQFPTYVGALDAWRPRLPVYEPLDWSAPGGTGVDALRLAKFIYTVPNYSNPTGALVSTAARQALLEKAMQAGIWLVEDDPYLPLQFDGAAGPSILALHGRMERDGPYEGPVVYLGTLSKSIVPGLRVGWTIASRDMIQALTLAKQSSDISSSMLTQAIALELLESGFETHHVPSIVRHYRQRREALCAAANAELGEWFEWDMPPGGMFVWMCGRHGAIDTDALYGFALDAKVAFVPGSVFDPAAKLRSAMRVNFTRSAPAVLEEGVSRLAAAVKRYLVSNH
ncbi:PLP-dependent aminotransferase family protein [Mesorhizobium sp. B2-1-3A]|uniref:aminotransferase-like domain-containing protein n=1 Tax=Mesorhizobium sp. B2-1-3A TaxID=2589971 RepID=UPI00112829E7|nr:PLP-dependent aminotransferase family protein [Mesorhizobium sp. B2-1-3A]TPM94884.1 PLP-dependent aminotransferase family protein [Mesorhizobium sp. B2-1-3A]